MYTDLNLVEEVAVRCMAATRSVFGVFVRSGPAVAVAVAVTGKCLPNAQARDL